jgi:hypothetical protein
MTSIEVQHTIKAGQVIKKEAINGKGNSLILSWGDQEILGPMGNVYRLGWDSGAEHGIVECFYVVEGWKGFDEGTRQGFIKVCANLPSRNCHLGVKLTGFQRSNHLSSVRMESTESIKIRTEP